MTSTANNVDNCEMYTKQCLNELNTIDILMKTMKNNTNKKHMWLSTCKNFNTTLLLNDMRRYGFLSHVWDGKDHGEKGTQPVKHEFVTKKENLLLRLWRGHVQKSYETSIT